MSGKNYVGATKRTFPTALRQLLEQEYGVINSERILEILAEDIHQLIEEFYPVAERLRPGWMLFTGTKAEEKKVYPGQSAADHPLVTLAWPVLLPEDIQAWATMPPGEAGKQARRDLLIRRLIRLVEYGWYHDKGPVLLTQADLGLMLGLSTVKVSCLLAEAREQTGKSLLTKGYFFDQGVRPSHKADIIDLYEHGVDQAEIARRTQHSPESVGHYIRDYEGVRTLVKKGFALAEIAPLLDMRPSVVKAYVKLIRLYWPDLLPEEEAVP